MVLHTGLEGSHVMITGAPRGIGKAMVEAFLLQGASVSYCARSFTGDEFNHVAAMHEAKAVGSAVDIGDETSLVEWVRKAGQDFGRIDSVIANASPMIMTTSSQDWRAAFEIDIVGTVSFINAALPILKKAPNPTIIIISSFMGREYFRPPPGPYGPFKAAQLQHIQELSHQYGPLGIRSNAISPGPITFPGGAWETLQNNDPDWVEGVRLKVPARRLGSPDEIANAAVWLASTQSSYVCGTNLLVDGGIHVGTDF